MKPLAEQLTQGRVSVAQGSVHTPLQPANRHTETMGVFMGPVLGHHGQLSETARRSLSLRAHAYATFYLDRSRMHTFGGD